MTMAMTRRDLIFGAMGAALLPARSASAGTMSVGGPAFGSSWRATVEATADVKTINGLVRSIVDDVDACFSPYRAESALSRFNATQTSEWQPVDPAFAYVTRTALRVANETGGAFDPTVGPLVARQGFGPIAGRAASFTDIDVRGKRLRKASPDATLDLCGIAKGHALDRIVTALSEAGVSRAIVDVGGEIRGIGAHPDRRPWAVAIADPEVPGAARHIVAPRGLALATSGHASNGVRGRASTSHIIDPGRRAPAAQLLRSVSVLHRSATFADALATALCAAGPEVGPDLARGLNIPALFIFDDAEHMIGGFEAYLRT